MATTAAQQEELTIPSAPPSRLPSLSPTMNRRVYSRLRAILTSAFATDYSHSSSSVLLHGPNGSGKSFTLRALTRDIGAHTITLLPSDLTPYLCSTGSTGGNQCPASFHPSQLPYLPGSTLEPDACMRYVFHRALAAGWRALVPTVIILDSVEALLPGR